MARVKRGVNARRRAKKVLKASKGYRGARSRHYRLANENLLKAKSYAYRDRKNKKRDFRKLWIARINAAVRSHGMSYSVFMGALNKAGVELDRKSLSELAINNPAAFSELVGIAREHAA